MKLFTDKAGVCSVPWHRSSICDPRAHQPWKMILLTSSITQLTYVPLVVVAEQSWWKFLPLSVPMAHWKDTIGFKVARGSKGASLECCHQLLVSSVLSILGPSGPGLGPSHQVSCLTPLIKARSLTVFIKAVLKHVKSDSDCSWWQEIVRELMRQVCRVLTLGVSRVGMLHSLWAQAAEWEDETETIQWSSLTRLHMHTRIMRRWGKAWNVIESNTPPHSPAVSYLFHMCLCLFSSYVSLLIFLFSYSSPHMCLYEHTDICIKKTKTNYW